MRGVEAGGGDNISVCGLLLSFTLLTGNVFCHGYRAIFFIKVLTNAPLSTFRPCDGKHHGNILYVMAAESVKYSDAMQSYRLAIAGSIVMPNLFSSIK